jgi:phage head maturation protease
MSETLTPDAESAAQNRSEIETRSSKVVGVSYPKRTIELIVMPYDEPTYVEYRGRVVREVIAPGSFDGIQRRPNRVRVNYHHQDHELRHQLGKAVSFHPSRIEGLVASVRIHGGPMKEYGDIALELADAGDLGASAGFQVMPGGENWPDRDTRRLTRLWLDHIALTPTPAYGGSRVLTVRSAEQPTPEQSATPNRDKLELLRLQEEKAVIDLRYGVKQR